MAIRMRPRFPALFAALAAGVAMDRAAAPPAAPGPSASPTPAPPPVARNIAGPGDYALRERLVSLMGRDPDLGHERIAVVLVNGGVVFSGEIRTCALETRALRLAASIRGVINVTDEMRVSRSTLPDGALRKAVASGLEDRAEALGLKDLRLRVEDGVASLEGTVTDFEARVNAEEITGAVAGITRVSNHLYPADVPEGRDDAALLKAVVEYMADDRRFGYPSEIEVRTQGGVVTLSGRVMLYLARQQAAVLASLVRGVSRVDNRLKVDPTMQEMVGRRGVRPKITGRT